MFYYQAKDELSVGHRDNPVIHHSGVLNHTSLGMFSLVYLSTTFLQTHRRIKRLKSLIRQLLLLFFQQNLFLFQRSAWETMVKGSTSSSINTELKLFLRLSRILWPNFLANAHSTRFVERTTVGSVEAFSGLRRSIKTKTICCWW